MVEDWWVRKGLGRHRVGLNEVSGDFAGPKGAGRGGGVNERVVEE